jgi:uncharacterized protein YutE (UPF0331/DUF86 family)
VVDERRVRRLLQRVEDDLAYLRARAGDDRHDMLTDADRLRALKYVFITAIEGCLDVAHHLCVSEGWGPPSSNADSMRVLGRHGVLADELADVMARGVGFRNVLVHGYADVDDRLVIAFLDHVPDLGAFVDQVSAWMRREPR